MTQLDPAASSERPFRQELWHAARYYLGGRMGIVLLATALLGAGAYLNWGWLVALGLAPIIISVLPCAAMCALGLCISGKSRAADAGATQSPVADVDADGSISPTLAINEENAKTKGNEHDRKGCC